MDMDAVAAFFEMGGYARFVWPSFGLTFVVMVGLWLSSRQSLGRAESVLSGLQATTGGRPRRRKASEGGDEA